MKNIFLLFIYFNLYFGYTLSAQSSKTTKNSYNLKELRYGNYKFINPLLDCYDLKSSNLNSNKQLQLKLNEYIKKSISGNLAKSVAVYYRDLNNGPWIGINEDDIYSPASLLKVPYLFAVLYQAQSDSLFLGKKVICNKNSSYYNEGIRDGFQLIQGNTYSIDELLSAMIIHSSNIAKDMLMKNLTSKSYYEIFNELGIDIAKYDTLLTTDFISVKDYASFFRVLYNATFLNKEMSEKALTLLSQTTFRDGIVAGVPESVSVSHKFGERFYVDSKLKQLHDCGIIYKPNQPYILCIMTKGEDNKKLETIIANISRLVYMHLNKTNNSTY